MEKVNRILDFIRSVFAEISSWLVLFVTLFITLDVVLRYFLKASIPPPVPINAATSSG